MAKSREINMNLPSADDLFTTQEERDQKNQEHVKNISVYDISDFPNHPFKVKMDAKMVETIESIREHGVLVPALVREKPTGGYEMISGHRRKMASELAGLESIPCIVRNLSDDEAVIVMVDSNLQREEILPSEKAFAYKMRFFDHIDHEWMMKFLEWNIQDKNLLWLIRKYLKAGIMEQGKFEPTEEGSAQGSVMSPMLANIYMHHVLTLWFKLVVQRKMQGECFLVNFADDFVAGFQYKSEAERYYKELKERMEKFGLELESSKSRLIEFGRFAEQNRRARGECKPETFDFLGFTFYYSKTRKGGFVPKVQTSRKKFEQKVRAYKNWIYDNRNRPMREIIKELNVKLIGHYRYYGVTWNFRKITTFLHRVQQFLFKAMNRRGCRRAYTWNGFVEMLKYYPLAKPKTYYCLY